MDYPVLYRKRLIPDECIELKNDVIQEYNEDILITSWKALNPKIDLDHGCSCYFLKEGYKISKFYRADSSLMYWYCDIIDYQYSPDKKTLTCVDLLADVVIYPDGRIRVIDLDELAEAFDKGLIDATLLKKALLRLNSLLTLIESEDFARIQALLHNF